MLLEVCIARILLDTREVDVDGFYFQISLPGNFVNQSVSKATERSRVGSLGWTDWQALAYVVLRRNLMNIPFPLVLLLPPIIPPSTISRRGYDRLIPVASLPLRFWILMMMQHDCFDVTEINIYARCKPCQQYSLRQSSVHVKQPSVGRTMSLHRVIDRNNYVTAKDNTQLNLMHKLPWGHACGCEIRRFKTCSIRPHCILYSCTKKWLRMKVELEHGVFFVRCCTCL